MLENVKETEQESARAVFSGNESVGMFVTLIFGSYCMRLLQAFILKCTCVL